MVSLPVCNSRFRLNGDVLHTVILGRRRIRLFAPDESAALYRHPCTVRSYVDLDAPVEGEAQTES